MLQAPPAAALAIRYSLFVSALSQQAQHRNIKYNYGAKASPVTKGERNHAPRPSATMHLASRSATHLDNRAANKTHVHGRFHKRNRTMHKRPMWSAAMHLAQVQPCASLPREAARLLLKRLI